MEIDFNSFDPEFWNPRDARYYRQQIQELTDESLNIFETATRETIQKYKEKLESYSHQMTEISHRIPDLVPDEPPTPEYWESHDEMVEAHMHYMLASEQITSICEMKIGYLFKSIETKMKLLIKSAYPSESYKDLYQWENMKIFFANKNIKLHLLKGHEEVTQIRKLNNNIKHNSEPTEEILKFPEFHDTPNIMHLRYEEFYNRTSPKAEEFIKQLGEEIIKDLFEFDESRLNDITEHYYLRLGNESTKKLIEKLQQKLPKRL